jgi:hypothetical protein
MQVNGVEYSCHRANPSIDGMLMLFYGLFRVETLPDVDKPFSEMGFFITSPDYILWPSRMDIVHSINASPQEENH